MTSVCLVSALAPRAAATLLVIAEATSRVRTSARKCGRPCCPCGCGLRHSPDAGVTREVARGSRDPRAVMGVRARLGAAPRAARNWGLVRPLLPAWPGASAVVFLAFLTRPAGGVAGEWPSELPNGHPSHHTTSPGTGCGLGAVPQSPSCPKGAWGRNFPNTAPSAKNAQLPTTVTHHRRVAHLGLAMGNLESEWDFDPAILALAKTPGHFALRVCAVDLKNTPQTAEALDKIKQCLAASQIALETKNIKAKPLRAGSTSTLQDVFIVALSHDSSRRRPR